MRPTRPGAGLLLGMAATLLVSGCGGSTAPSLVDPTGAWVLETVDGRALPHAYADTNGPVVSSGMVLADTLVLLEGEQGERLTWLDDGSGSYRLSAPILWGQPRGPSSDSVTVTEIIRVGGVHHPGVVRGDRLTLRIEYVARPGTYVYSRAPR